MVLVPRIYNANAVTDDEGVETGAFRFGGNGFYVLRRLEGLTTEQAEEIAQMLDEAHDNGIKDQLLEFKRVMRMI